MSTSSAPEPSGGVVAAVAESIDNDNDDDDGDPRAELAAMKKRLAHLGMSDVAETDLSRRLDDQARLLDALIQSGRAPAAAAATVAGPCARPECVRVRALLRQQHGARYVAPAPFWVLCMLASLLWHVFCIQQGRLGAGLLNLGLAFLPLWRRMWTETPWYWNWVSLAALAFTVVVV